MKNGAGTPAPSMVRPRVLRSCGAASSSSSTTAKSPICRNMCEGLVARLIQLRREVLHNRRPHSASARLPSFHRRNAQLALARTRHRQRVPRDDHAPAIHVQRIRLHNGRRVLVEHRIESAGQTGIPASPTNVAKLNPRCRLHDHNGIPAPLVGDESPSITSASVISNANNSMASATGCRLPVAITAP